MMNKFVFTNNVSAGALEQFVCNVPKLMSSANRKQFHNVDRNGNAQLYTLAITPMSTAQALSVWTAPNNYVTKRAVKAWHDARVKMLKRAGLSLKDLGPYGRTIRPYFNVAHENSSEAEAAFLPGFSGDEWTYTRLAVSTPAESTSSGNINEFDLVDTYSLTLTGASVYESGTPDSPDESGATTDEDSFVSVGMIGEWLDSFKKRPIPTHTDDIISSDNALLQLNVDSASSEEVLEIVEDTNLEQPPWDGDGATYQNQLFADYIISTSHQSTRSIVQVPCGLFRFQQENFHSAGENCHVKIEVLAIEDM